MNWNNLELPDKNIYFQDDDSIIYCDDCRNVLPLLPDKSIDLVLTDPPYGVNATYSDSYKDIKQDYWEWFLNLMPTLRRVSSITIFTHQVRALSHILDADWVGCWYKPNANSGRLGNSHIFPCWEPIFMYGIHDMGGLGYRKDTFVYDAQTVEANGQEHGRERLKGGVSKGHPFPKPSSLYSELAQTFSLPQSLILDPFLGSGTTAYCAKKLGRKCIGIEIEEKYCEIAAKRCSQSVLRL